MIARLPRLVTSLLVALPLALGAARGWACPACVEGDDGGRADLAGTSRTWSAQLSVEAWRDRLRGGDGQALEVVRATPSLAWRTPWLDHSVVLSAALPLSLRRQRSLEPDLELARTSAPGDLDTSATWSPAQPGVTQSASATLGVRWPTAPEVESNGAPVSDDVQPGSGAFTLLAGAGVQSTTGTWTLSGSWIFAADARLFVPVVALRAERPGGAAALDLRAERRIGDSLGLEAGAWTRGDLAAADDDGPIDDTGGVVTGALAGASWHAASGLSVGLRTRVPVASIATGNHERGPALALWLRWAGAAGADDEGPVDLGPAGLWR
jgi:hypothetical protein